MPFVVKHDLSEEEQDAALVMLDTLLFAKLFFASDLTMPRGRLDLPREWASRQIISREQRIMFLAGREYMLMRNEDPSVTLWSPKKMSLRTSRKIAKTVGFEARWIQIALCKTETGVREGMVHAPGEAHMAPVRKRVESRIAEEPLFEAMQERFDRDTGIQTWKNGWTWHVRIEGMQQSAQRAGRSQVGIRACAMLGDEADFSDGMAWEQREQSALPDAYFYEGGVPRGFRGKFWRIANTAEGTGWLNLRYDMRANPLYHSQQAWDEQIGGNYYSQRTQTQVLGFDGEEAISSFPIIPVDQFAPYRSLTLTDTDFDRNRYRLSDYLSIPVTAHMPSKADAWMIAGDYGYSPSPSELYVIYRNNGVWRTLARYECLHLDTYPTAELIHELDKNVLPQRADLIMIDAHGQGSGVLSTLHKNENWATFEYGKRAIDANFAGTMRIPGVMMHKRCRSVVKESDGMAWACDKCHMLVYDRDEVVEATIPTKTYLMGRLKELFAYGMRALISGDENPRLMDDALILGPDDATINELSGTTEIQLANSIRIVTPTNSDHMMDGMLCVAGAIHAWADAKRQLAGPSIEEFGWAAGYGGGTSWRAPWE